jgi:hypothetical protein
MDTTRHLLLPERNGILLENPQKSVATAVMPLLIIRGQAETWRGYRMGKASVFNG